MDLYTGNTIYFIELILYIWAAVTTPHYGENPSTPHYGKSPALPHSIIGNSGIMCKYIFKDVNIDNDTTNCCFKSTTSIQLTEKEGVYLPSTWQIASNVFCLPENWLNCWIWHWSVNECSCPSPFVPLSDVEFFSVSVVFLFFFFNATVPLCEGCNRMVGWKTEW